MIIDAITDCVAKLISEIYEKLSLNRARWRWALLSSQPITAHKKLNL